MRGTPSQIEWAEQIKPRVNAEFDRVANALQSVAASPEVIAILEEKRTETMTREEAGYFIREWQELRDQVRKLIAQDSRYQAIKAKRVARHGEVTA